MEFLIADALDKHSDCLVTHGGLQSNHARATALAGKQFGLDTHMLLFDKEDRVRSDGRCKRLKEIVD